MAVVICPFRLTERRQVFTDCLHLLTLHEPGNEFHVIPEVSLPGGSIDYVRVSAKSGHVRDFVGIELQTLDTTGTVWPERQRFLRSVGISVPENGTSSTKTFGMNWKMTAKTILIQLHHKIETFETVGRHLVLAVQTHLMDYMQREFDFGHLDDARLGDSMHFHAYSLSPDGASLRLELNKRLSTDERGIAQCLGRRTEATMELDAIHRALETRMSADTLFTMG